MEKKMDFQNTMGVATIGCLTLLTILLTWTLWWLLGHTQTRRPPGPIALPIVGNLPYLMALMWRDHPMHRVLHNLSLRYGPLMGLQFGSKRVLVASTPSAARLVLQTHDNVLSGRAPTMAAKLFYGSPGLGVSDILFSQPGPYWKLMRQLSSTELFSTTRVRAFRSLIEEEVHDMLRSTLRATSGANVIIRDELHSCTSNIISRMALGKRFNEVSCSSSEINFVKTLLEAIRCLGILNISDFFPSLEWMDLQGHNHHMKAISMSLETFLHSLINERRKSRAKSTNPCNMDFLDILLEMVESTKDDDVPILDGHVKGVLMDMFGGGTDTSSITIEWALAELLANHDKLDKIQEELMKVVGNSRLVEIADIPKLPYLSAVVKETMRLHPVLPLLIPHEAIQSCMVDGYEILKSTQVFINVWAIGRAPEVWENALNFYPERFLESNISIQGQHFGFLAFGSGRRICPAWMLGLLTVELILANLVHAIDLKASDKPQLTESPETVIMTLKTPLSLKACPKAPTQPFMNS